MFKSLFAGKQKIFFAIFSTLILVGPLTILIIVTGADIYKQATITLNLRQNLFTRTNIITALPKLQSDFQVAETFNAVLKKIFSSSEASNRLLSDSGSLEKKYKISAAVAYQNQGSFILTGSGSLDGIQKFLKELQNGPYAIVFKTTEISKTKTEYTATITGKLLTGE